MVTGVPSIARKRPLKAARWSGRSFWSAPSKARMGSLPFRLALPSCRLSAGRSDREASFSASVSRSISSFA
jgi:hypothetical protein